MGSDEFLLLNEAKKAVTYWEPRTKKIKAWYKMARLVDTLADQADKGYDTIVSNRPRAFRNLALHLLSSGTVIDEIPIGREDRTERDLKSKSEWALQSLWREKDQEQIEAGEMIWRRQFADFAFMTGWWAIHHGVYDDNGTPYFRADILNPANVFQRWVNRKLHACYHVYPLSNQDARYLAKSQKWPDPQIVEPTKGNREQGTPSVLVYQCFLMNGSDVIYAVYINSKAMVKPKVQKKLKKIPILTAPIGGFADRGMHDDGTEYIARIGESLLEPIAGVNLRKNKLRSYLQQVAKRIAQPTPYDVTFDGQGILTPKSEGKIQHLKPGEAIGTMKYDVQAMPELNILLGQDDTEEQLATIPTVAYGTTMGLEFSGYLYQQMLTAAYSSLGEINHALNSSRGIIGKGWLDGFKEHFKKDKAIGIAGDKSDHTGFFSEEFTPATIPNLTYVKTKGELAMPQNMMQRIQAARQAIPEGDLMDFVTVASDLLQLQDPQLVQSRIKESHMENSIEMEQLSLLNQMQKKLDSIKEEDPAYAEILRWGIARLKQQYGYQPAKSGGAPAAGINPEVQPPEARGEGTAERRAREGRPARDNISPKEIGASMFRR